jgi:hypothetical protein
MTRVAALLAPEGAARSNPKRDLLDATEWEGVP